MWAHKKNNNHGFTIVETLIVLAVTAAMFMATVSLVSGQVARHQYQSSMRQVQTLIQRQISEVQSGYFNGVMGGDNNEANGGKVIVGKRITIMQGTNDIKVQTLTEDLNALPITSASNPGIQNETLVKLPTNLEFKSGVSNVVINILYSSATRGNSGYYAAANASNQVSAGDSVAVYDSSYNRITETNKKPSCITDGGRKGIVTFGGQNSLSVDLNMAASVADWASCL